MVVPFGEPLLGVPVGREASTMSMKKVAPKQPAPKAGKASKKNSTSGNGKRGRKAASAPAMMSAEKALSTITIGNFASEIGNVDTSKVPVDFSTYVSESKRNKGKEYLNLVVKVKDADGNVKEKFLTQPDVQLLWNCLTTDKEFLLKVTEFVRNIPAAN